MEGIIAIAIVGAVAAFIVVSYIRFANRHNGSGL